MFKAGNDNLTSRLLFPNRNLRRDEKRETKKLKAMMRSISPKIHLQVNAGKHGEDVNIMEWKGQRQASADALSLRSAERADFMLPLYFCCFLFA